VTETRRAEINAKCRNAEEPKSRAYKFPIILKHKNKYKNHKNNCLLSFVFFSGFHLSHTFTVPSACFYRAVAAFYRHHPNTNNIQRTREKRGRSRSCFFIIIRHQTGGLHQGVSAGCRKETRKANECVPPPPTDTSNHHRAENQPTTQPQQARQTNREVQTTTKPTQQAEHTAAGKPSSAPLVHLLYYLYHGRKGTSTWYIILNSDNYS
jgi:hypothetical protein